MHQKNIKKRNRSNEDMESDDGANSYIIGPESNHSMIQNRDFRRKGSEQDRYLKVTRDREFEEEFDDHNGGNAFAKKRKVKKAT